MSMMTNYASLTARPSLSAEAVLHFQALHIDSSTMLLVMVVETGGRHCAKTVYISAPGITEEAVMQIEICLNEEISGRCRMLSPIVDEVAEERTDIKVGKVNVDEQPELAGEFGVMSIPTLLVFRDGKLVNQAVGARPKAGVLALLG